MGRYEQNGCYCLESSYFNASEDQIFSARHRSHFSVDVEYYLFSLLALAVDAAYDLLGENRKEKKWMRL